MPAVPVSAPARDVDPVALARVSARLARAREIPWLHAEVARRMAERLAIVKRQPAAVIDWGARLGGGSELLRAAYPQARRLLVEADDALRSAAEAAVDAPWWTARRWRQPPVAVHAPGTLPAASGDLLWSNMTLHGAADPRAVIAAWHRALAVDGFLMFSTLGPGTFESLSALYREAGWPPPFAPFVDMHDLGDMLVEAGFADPVMDQEQITLTWPSAPALLAELRTLGGNVHPRRHAGLRTPRWREGLLDRLAGTAGADGRPRLVVEVVYGHAFRVAPRPRVQGETTVALDDMRAMMRSRRTN